MEITQPYQLVGRAMQLELRRAYASFQSRGRRLITLTRTHFKDSSSLLAHNFWKLRTIRSLLSPPFVWACSERRFSTVTVPASWTLTIFAEPAVLEPALVSYRDLRLAKLY